jgi:type II secretory pathway pseudopilin PulG
MVGGRATARRRRPRAQAGYNLVFLAVLFSLMSVALTAALPDLKKQIQREKESELIFRGLQYAEAIRVFQQRFGRFPNTLSELIEVEPRSIRQLWTDPMTPEGTWALVLASGSAQQQGEESDEEEATGRELTGASGLRSSFSPSGSVREGQLSAGPIQGVATRKKGQAIRTFLGKNRYEEWRFTVGILPKPQVVPGTEIIVRGSVENLGKPFPFGLQAQALETLGGDGEDLAGDGGLRDLFDDEDEDDG